MRTTLGDTARLLSSARRDVRRITLDPDQKPVDVAEAYAVQDAVGGLLVPGGAPTLGWKVGAPDARAVPSAAPIYQVLFAPARIPASSLNMIGVEAEIAYVFAAGLPRRATPYSTDEALRAVGGCCVAIEVCDSRLADWQAADDLTKLADHGLNYALVIGVPARQSGWVCQCGEVLPHAGREQRSPMRCAACGTRYVLEGAVLRRET